ncbi:MAG TPA: response regulator [Geminicoccaceae bacterium]|nr:response regulator [Geminicoccaceae bacterium]
MPETVLRVLVLEDDPTDAFAMRRELAGRFEVTLAATLADALVRLTTPGLKPDVIVTDLNLPDSNGPRTLEILRGASPDIPIVVSTGHLSEGVRRQLDLLGVAHLHDKNDGFALLRAVLQHTESVHHSIAVHKAHISTEIERVARLAAEEAAGRAIGELVQRLGLHDEEGVRMAVRLARGWDAAKSRFAAAIAAGLASALLLAVSAGIVAILKNQGSK